MISEGGDKAQKQPVTRQAPAKGAWAGKVVRLVGASARPRGARRRPGSDASGGKVSYGAANLTDGVADTTWRCDGIAVGEKITLRARPADSRSVRWA